MARDCGLQRSYTDTETRRRGASVERLLAVLRAFGQDVSRPEEAEARLRERLRDRWRRPLEPVLVAWDGELAEIRIRAPAARAAAVAGVTVVLEGEMEGVRIPTSNAPRGPVLARGRVGRSTFVEVSVGLDRTTLPSGYHELRLEEGGLEAAGLLISAPSRAPSIPHRSWGVFAPLYALRTPGDRGVGDMGDLEELVEWVAGLGGSVVATLPLLAAFLDQPFESSPYSPASRLFWNELYLDLSGIPELAGGPAGNIGHRAVGHPTSQGSDGPARPGAGANRDEPHMQDHVDYRRAMALTRDALDVAATAIHGSRAAELDRWVAAHPRVRDYARFRAATERRATAWTAWPLAEREGRLRPDPPRERVHLLAQWLMDRQLTDVARTARRRGGGLQFDLPLGVNLAGYDVWRHREAFALEANAGAPPDSFFPGGQDWGFPPLHPERIRDQRYAYPIACIRTLARHASVLRIDHVMGLHRLFWVPRELGPDHGVYVRSRPDELSAILSLEAHRAGAVVLGEDLGTVPRYVRDAMDRRGLYRTFVLQEELRSDRRAAVRRPPSNSVASLNTHDMPTFASFWRSLDIDERRARGWLSPADAKREHARRATLHGALLAFLGARGLLHGAGRPRDEDVLRACLAYLASSESAVVTVSVEDLWLETRPQNVPGTTDEEPNWRRRLAKDLPTFRADAGVVGTLEMIDRLRKGGGG